MTKYQCIYLYGDIITEKAHTCTFLKIPLVEFKSEKFPLRRPAVFLQTAILSSLIYDKFFIVQRHGWMKTQDYITEDDYFL